jgi:hypothetical protein
MEQPPHPLGAGRRTGDEGRLGDEGLVWCSIDSKVSLRIVDP